LLPQKPDGIFLTEEKTAFVTLPPALCAYPHKTIDMRRFVDLQGAGEIRGALSVARRTFRQLMHNALTAFDGVRKAHFGLESIYMESMDFDAKENFTKAFCDALFHLQNR
jgi:hypothetical protein